MKPLLPIMDILIGFTAGLHIVCFKEQTGNYQPDINRHPLFFSYTYIIVVLLFDSRGTQIPIWSFIKNIEMDTETCLHLKKKSIFAN